ncbi:L-dopachrome tautomerase-related protein [Vibrio sp. TH_r3]|uniref:L-dopachrome tautomerase-related protein n=1 Tax=Vibrio sp. TH_r3 TaxID=3082084 RepID=UPI0029558878|nr:L-dopachrome tautomerase-related protein [Vibrio sp. TH_r3]MDV7105135.1 L-dopachrome tautomerase-related protein [Vibrio sp. TH_r3]
MKGKSLLTLTLLSASVIAAPEPKLEIVAEWDALPYLIRDKQIKQRWETSQLYGKALMQGVKVDKESQLYVTTARWGGPDIPATLSKLTKTSDGYSLVPYPSEELNDINNPKGLKAVLGFEIDRDNVMWILDQGHVADQPTKAGDEKLILWDIGKNKEIQRYEFTDKDSSRTCSFLNDVAVDNDSGFAYITDSGILCQPLDGGLIVYDSNTNTAKRVLSGTKFTNNDKNFFFNINGKPVLSQNPMLTGADGIALSGDKKTLYWTNLTGNTLYSIETALLRDFKRSEAELQASVKTVTNLPSNTDGMTADRDNNLYMTGLTINGIMKRDGKTGDVSRLTYDENMVWPDTLAWGPDNQLYISSNNLHTFVDGKMNFKNPKTSNFKIWKLDVDKKSYTAK